MTIVSLRPLDRITDEFGDLDVVVHPKRRYTEAELIDLAAGASALFVHSENQYTAELFANAPDLRVIGKPGSGIDNIDLEAATEHGIVVLHSPGGNGPAVAEFTIGSLISLARKIPAAQDHLRNGGWRSTKWEGTELRNKTVGLVGLGSAGYETARRLRPFDVDLLVTDPFIDEERAESVGAERVPLETLCRRSDAVSLHVRLTDETRGLIGAEEFALLPDHALLVNTARGPVIDRDALLEALETGAIGGAALDVYHEEPPNPSDRLFEFDNVITTPHLAGATVETRDAMIRTTAANVRSVLADEPVDRQYVANPEVLE